VRMPSVQGGVGAHLYSAVEFFKVMGSKPRCLRL
jgi:hypothetical protein